MNETAQSFCTHPGFPNIFARALFLSGPLADQLVDMRNKDLPVSHWRKEGEEYEVPDDEDDDSDEEEGAEVDGQEEGDEGAEALTLQEVLQAGEEAEANGQLIE